jgi:hypothetical protein
VLHREREREREKGGGGTFEANEIHHKISFINDNFFNDISLSSLEY